MTLQQVTEVAKGGGDFKLSTNQIANLDPMGNYLLPPIDNSSLLRDKAGRREEGEVMMATEGHNLG